MPTYEYKCDACGFEFEKFQSIKSAAIKKCPHCGKNRVRRLIGIGAAVIFKGGGFYTTDYRSEAYKSDAKADSGEKPASTDTKSGDTKSGDTKTDTKAGGTEPVAKPAAETKPATESKSKTESKPVAESKPSAKSTTKSDKSSK
jgi:putative FmdB family regulatory protein